MRRILFATCSIMIVTTCYLFSCTGKKPKKRAAKAITTIYTGPYNHKQKVTDTFDDKGHLLKTFMYDELNHRYLSASYKYDSVGNRIEMGQYFQDGKQINGSTKYSYNEKRQLTSTTEFLTTNDDHSWDIYYTYTYDSSGRLARKTLRQHDIFETTSYSYPDKYTTVEQVEFKDSPEISVTLTTRNEKGDVINVRQVTDGDTVVMRGACHSTRYGGFDNVGNWLVDTQYNDILPPSVSKRAIQYY